MKKVILIIVILVLIAASFFAGYNYAISKDSSQDTTKKGSSESVVKEVQAKLVEMSDLSTYSGEYTITINKDDPKFIFEDIKLLFSENHISLKASGIVKVGYDFESIKIKIEGNKIIIALPEPKVLDNYVIWDSVVCKERNNIINPIKFEQYQEIITEIEASGLEKVESMGIYDKADEQLKVLIDGFLSGFTDYEIEYM